RDEYLKDEHRGDLTGGETDRLHDPDLTVRGDNDPGYEVRDDRHRRHESEDAEGNEDPDEDLIHDVEDAADEKVIDRARDAPGRKGGPQRLDSCAELGAGRIAREAIVHEVVTAACGRQPVDCRGADPGALRTDVRANLVDVDDLARDRGHRRIRDADHLERFADRDVTQIRERTRYRDLVVADRPPAGHQNELPDLSA